MTEWKLPDACDFDGRAVRYGVSGDGPPVVVVHGTPWSSFNFRHIIKALSQDFTVHYYDLIGYGQSDKSPGDVSLGIQNQVLDRLLDHWQIDNPSIIGHDFGGATVLRTHLINGRDFDKIVLIDPVAVAPWGSSFFQHVRAHEAAFAGVPDYIHEAIVRAYVKTAAFKPIDEATLESIVWPWTEPDGKGAFYRQMAQANSGFTDEVQPLYARISRPVLILWGCEDTWIPLERGEALRDMIPGSSLHVIPDAGHLVIEEQPDQLMKKIHPFIHTEFSQFQCATLHAPKLSYLNEHTTRQAVENLGVTRVLFGTDGPYGVHGDDDLFDYSFLKRRIEGLFPDKEIQKKILGENFLELTNT